MILLVDDRPENLLSLKGTLQQHGHEVHTAASGEAALGAALRHDYDLIILDVQMPGMDGYEVATELGSLKRTRDIPILFLSAAHVEKSFITRGLRAGGIDYLPKPVDPDILLLKVATFMRLGRTTRDLQQLSASLQKEVAIRKAAEERLEEQVAERTRALTEANATLYDRNRALEEFAYIASHDLKEPLRKMQVFADMLTAKTSGEVDPNVTDLSGRIAAGARRMSRLIDDLLQFSRLDAPLHTGPVPLHALVSKVVADLGARAKALNAAFALPDPATDVVIEGAPGLLEQLFQNLYFNALKFCKEDAAPHITTTWTAQPDLGQVTITVADNGIGFDPQFSEKIFTIFQRLHDQTRYEGTGIGLALVRKIVEKHHGVISASSGVGCGATFTFVLPLHPAQP